MLPVARVSDRTIGVCYCHNPPIVIGGTVITGEATDFVNSLNDSRITDIVLADCGHTGVLITGQVTFIVNNKPTVRLTDQFTGCYVGNIITASPDTYTK